MTRVSCSPAGVAGDPASTTPDSAARRSRSRLAPRVSRSSAAWQSAQASMCAATASASPRGEARLQERREARGVGAGGGRARAHTHASDSRAANLLGQQLLHPVLTQVDLRHAHAQFRRHRRRVRAREGGALERRPGRPRHARPHPGDREVQQLPVERRLDPRLQVRARLRRMQLRQHRRVARAARPPRRVGDEVVPGVVRQRLQPPAERLGRVVGEARQLRGQPHQHRLGHVLRVALLKPPALAPVPDDRAVERDELRPVRLAPRLGGDAAQERHARGVGRVVSQGRTPVAAGNFHGRSTL